MNDGVGDTKALLLPLFEGRLACDDRADLRDIGRVVQSVRPSKEQLGSMKCRVEGVKQGEVGERLE